MSYRAFKRLLGETSLERKCRFLLGSGILLLITASFWLYARQTEHLAYDQTKTTGRLLVNSVLADLHVSPDRRASLADFQQHTEETWPRALDGYKYQVLKPNALKPEGRPDSDEIAILKGFQADPDRSEDSRMLASQQAFQYYGAVRARASCLKCHPVSADEARETGPLAEDSLMAVVRIHVPVKAIEDGFHFNRALLISTALVTAMLIMAGSYVIIRYVIVKPVKHLKEVSDAIAAGQLNVRSEIQTGDEFEDLSHAFNRMLRNLVSMQDRLQRVNGDLDRKVDELARLNLALYDSNRAKGDFLAAVSHEFRTPLHIILGFSEQLLDSPTASDKQKRWAANIRTAGQDLLNLLNDILDLARVEAGKMQVRPEDFHFAELADSLLGMFRPVAEKKNIDLRGQTDLDLPPLRQDAGKLRQILSNLLSNAIKFTPEGGRVLLKAEAEGSDIVLRVVDTGVGIALADQERVFEKFRQAANPMTREQGGTGLGLSIVRELCKLLQGEVTLQSELGRGSTFTVRLPAQLREDLLLDFDLSAGERSGVLASGRPTTAVAPVGELPEAS